MPFPEGSSKRIVQTEDGHWKCIHCDFTRDRYQEVIGHLGRHNENRRKPTGRPKKPTEPLDMTIKEMVDEIGKLRSGIVNLTTALDRERRRNSAIRAALADFMEPQAEQL